MADPRDEYEEEMYGMDADNWDDDWADHWLDDDDPNYAYDDDTTGEDFDPDSPY